MIGLYARVSTDGFGQVEFSLNDLLSYKLNVSKVGYETFYESFSVVDSDYTVTLDFDDVSENYYSGVLYSFSPVDGLLSQNASYNFSFNFSSSILDVTGCWFSVGNVSSIFSLNSSFCSVSSGFVVNSFNVSMYDSIWLRGVLEFNNSVNLTYVKVYSVKNYYKGDFSLAVFFDDLSDFDSAGFSGFARFLIALVVSFGLVWSANKSSVVVDGGVSMLLLTAIIGFFSLLNWLYVPNIPYGAGQYIIFIFASVLTIAVVVYERVS